MPFTKQPSIPPPLVLQDLLAPYFPQTIMLSMLGPSGVWYPLNWVGPTAGSASSANLTGAYTGVGFARIPRPGTLTNFKITMAGVSGSDITNLQIYIAPSGDPGLIAFSGVTLSILTGDYTSSDPTTLAVATDDLVAIYNADPSIGWSPGAMTITADLI